MEHTVESVETPHMGFEPEVLTVVVGDAVVWANKGSIDHTATRDDDPPFDTGDIAPGNSSALLSFDTPSEGLDYACAIHPHMKGKIIVTEA